MSLCQNLSLHEKCLVSQLKNSENFSVPETFHFLLEDAGHFLSIVYPKSKLDRDLSKFFLVSIYSGNNVLT